MESTPSEVQPHHAEGPQRPPSRRRGAWAPWAVAAVAVAVAAASWLWPRADGVAVAAGPSATSTPLPAATAKATAAPSAGSAQTGAVALGTPEKSFSTPQAAVTFLTQRLAAGDTAGAMAAFATTSAVNGYDFAAQVTRQSAFSPFDLMPSSSPYYRTLNLAQRTSSVATQLRAMTWSIVDPRDNPANSISVSDASVAVDLERRLDPAPMAHLGVVHLDQIAVSHPQLARNFPQIAAPYGADEYAEFGILFDTANGPMSGGISFLRYGDKWLIFNLNSLLLGTPYGGLTASSEQDYAATIAPEN